MNAYFWIILATLIIGYALDLIADWVNLKNLSTDMPEEFKGTFDEESYKKSQEYEKTRTKFGQVSSTFSLIVLLAFWFLGGFNWLDSVVRVYFDSEIWRGLVFIGALVVANTIISLPFSIYSTFVIEEKYGFNKTTPKVFVLDMLKSLGLTIAIAGPILAAILYFFQAFGDWAWLMAWGAVVLFSLIAQYLAPTLIMPLFNKFTPLEEGELRDSIFKYAESVDYPLKNIFVMDGSKRSTKSNAFFTGFGKNKRIALFDTLIKKHGADELVSILAHEIGHYKKKHILIGTIISFVHTGILFYLLSIFLDAQGLYEAFFMDSMSIYAGLIFFGLLYSPIELILSILMNIVSRKNEFAADRFAIKTTKKKEPFVKAMKTLSRHNLSNLTPHPFYVFINYSHPPVLERIRSAETMELE